MVFGLCMDSDVFLRLFGGLNVGSGSGQASLVHSGNSNPILFGFTVTLIALGICTMLPIYRTVLQTLFSVPWLAALYVECLVSMLWSVDRATTFRYSITLWAYLACALGFTYFTSIKQALATIGNTVFGLALLSIAIEFIAPHHTSVPGWSGVYGEKNHLGIGMTIGMIAVAVPRERWTLVRIAKLLVMSILLMLSQSGTALVVTVISAYLLVLLRCNLRFRKLWLILPVVFLVTAAVVVPNFIDHLFALGGKNTTFTGRDTIWAFSFNQWMAKFFLGWGYTAFWISQEDLITQSLGWNPLSAHNGILDTGLALGIVGVLFTVGIVIAAFREGFYVRKYVSEESGPWLLISLVVLLVHNMMETDFLIPAPLWFVFTASYFAAQRSRHCYKANVAGVFSSQFSPGPVEA